MTVRQVDTANKTEFSGYANGWGKFLVELRELAASGQVAPGIGGKSS